MKYTRHIYEAVKSFNLENYNQVITDEQIDTYSRERVLRQYLSWEGIIGYDLDILIICGLNN